jgi:protocatechuate 3,4-dioxygenase alpha subunit
MKLPRTPSQTVGPYYAIGLCRRDESELAPGGAELTGFLLDGQGEPIPDGVVELWDAAGRRFARCGTEDGGRFRFLVSKPDALPGETPRLDVLVHARGILRHQITRIYFPDERNEDDPVFASLDPDARQTLVAQADGEALRFDIRMQGERATVFFVQ